ncbi:hypothetical protein CH063_08394, partial [Colletotrichum higginsianum]
KCSLHRISRLVSRLDLRRNHLQQERENLRRCCVSFSSESQQTDEQLLFRYRARSNSVRRKPKSCQSAPGRLIRPPALRATALVSQIPGYTSLSLATCPGTIPITMLL